MSANKPVAPPLVAAAQVFEDELARVEDLATQLERASISSGKTLLRAGALLEEAGVSHERLGVCLTTLVAAIETMRVRQQAALERVLVETRRVQARNEEYRELMSRFAALGARAKEVNVPVSRVIEEKDAGSTPETLLGALAVVEELTDGVVTDADSVADAAKAGGWSEIMRDALALRQSMQAARNKLLLARRSVAARASS